jgi:hypothetical protein
VNVQSGPKVIEPGGRARAEERPRLSQSRALEVAGRLLARPGWTLLGLTILVASIEFAQSWHEILPGGHAIGEVIRNLAYALIGALIFHWVVVEYPEGRRRRSSYVYHELDFQFLTTTGLGLLNETRHVAKQVGLSETVDAWNQVGVQKVCAAAWNAAPLAYKQARHAMLTSAILGVRTSLDGLARSSAFFDPDVAQALAHFPSDTGFQQLQLLEVTDPDQGARDGHIVWLLLEAGRRVYSSLRDTAPFVDLKVEGALVEFPDGTRIHHQMADLYSPALGS